MVPDASQGHSGHSPLNTTITELGVWMSQCDCYRVTFGTEKSLRWYDGNYIYRVSVSLGQGLEAIPSAQQPLPQSPYAVMMRPAELDVDPKDPSTSGPGPQFDETEAGRTSVFGVVPRDKFGNTLALNEFGEDGLNVELQVALSGPESVMTCDVWQTKDHPGFGQPGYSDVCTEQSGDVSQIGLVHGQSPEGYECREVSETYGGGKVQKGSSDYPRCMNISWDATGTVPAGWDRHLPVQNERHFNTAFLLTVSGVYTFKVSLSDLVASSHMETVGVASIAGSPFHVMVIPSELDPSKTYILKYFASTIKGTIYHADTVKCV